MPTYKQTFFYEDTVNNLGWTESYWCDASNVTAAAGLFLNYWPVRKALTFTYVFIRAWRVSNVDKERDSIYQPLPSSGSDHGTIDPTSEAPSGPEDCLLLRRENDAGNLFSHLFLAQVPGGIFHGRQYPAASLPSGWATAMTNFQVELVSGPYKIKTGFGGTPVFAVITNVIPLRWTSRKRGRPFDPHHGRAKRR